MTVHSTGRSIGQLVADALDDVRAIIDHEKALAKAEITRAAKAGGIGAGLLLAAVSMISLAMIYLLISAAEGLVEAGMTRWAAFLLVGGVLLLVGLVLGSVGAIMLKRVRGPQRAVEQGKGTVEDVKEAFSHDSHAGHDRHAGDAAKQTAKTGLTVVVGTRGAADD